MAQKCVQLLRLGAIRVQNSQVSTSCVMERKKLVNPKKHSKSSQEWLLRQLNDPYVERAKMENYRARSAFKLIEMDDRFQFLCCGQLVIECGAAPGAWTQVLTKRINATGTSLDKRHGRVIAVDLLPMYPVEGADIITMADFTKPATQQKILELMGSAKADIVLTDMAPNATGVAELDQDIIVNLVYSAFRFAVLVSKPKAHFLAKVWAGAGVQKLREDLERFYSIVKEVKPPASRGDSAEMFLLAKDFKGLKR